MKTQRFLIALVILGNTPAPASPPPPPEGYVWVCNEQFCDEFNGTALDSSKWNDHYPGWNGRAPAKFVSSAISVTNGCLEIRGGTLPQPEGNFTLAGGAVTSRSVDAFYGYYEARMKASKICMSSTFWLSTDRLRTGDRTAAQEIDINETIGAPNPEPTWGRDYNKFMNSNTHFFHTSPGKKEDLAVSGRAPLDPPADEAFHTYAAWWVDANTVRYYLNDEYKFTLHPNTRYSATPFDRPMHVNMVVETYDWTAPPTAEDVNNPAINTTRYDWVRAYALVKAEK